MTHSPSNSSAAPNDHVFQTESNLTRNHSIPPAPMFLNPWMARCDIPSEQGCGPLASPPSSAFSSPLELDWAMNSIDFNYLQTSCQSTSMTFKVGEGLAPSSPPRSTIPDKAYPFGSHHCDSHSMNVISKLYECQLYGPRSPVNSTLIHARQSLALVSDCLSYDRNRPTQSIPCTSSATLALACIQIAQQVFTCYVNLRSQLASLDDQSGDNSICIGGFQVQGAEICQSVLEVIVAREMDSCKEVVGRLKTWSDELELAGNEDSSILVPFIMSLQARIASDLN